MASCGHVTVQSNITRTRSVMCYYSSHVFDLEWTCALSCGRRCGGGIYFFLNINKYTKYNAFVKSCHQSSDCCDVELLFTHASTFRLQSTAGVSFQTTASLRVHGGRLECRSYNDTVKWTMITRELMQVRVSSIELASQVLVKQLRANIFFFFL